MKYDLKKTKTSDAETLKHCLTALYCCLDLSNEYAKDGMPAISKRKWKDAEKYLKDYIKELFKQNI